MPTCEKCGTSFSEQHRLDKASNLCPNCYMGISHADGLKLVQKNDSDTKWFKKLPCLCEIIVIIIVAIAWIIASGDIIEFLGF